MYVYRIEHKDNRQGPFSSDAAYHYDNAHRYDDAVSDPYYSCRHMPTPYSSDEAGSELYEKSINSSHYFAFANIGQLLMAFPSKKGRYAMKCKNTVLAVYEVPRDCVVEGFHQVVFVKKAARHVRNIDLVTCEE